MKIGIFGGTFNPIHLAHLYIAEEVRETLELDEVIFVPAAVPPHKEVEFGVSAEHRLKMVELAIADNPAFKVSDVELKLPTPSYSVKTVEHFQELYGKTAKLFFITGMDTFIEIGTWHDVDRLMGMCDFVTTFRPGIKHFDLSGHRFTRTIDMVMLEMLDAKERKLGKCMMSSGRDLYLVSTFGMEISSTEIRKRLHDRKSVKYLLPADVESYIIRNGLYKKAV
ncbi:MAG TPA: nicotinate-nucleotide adenylyltransferase [Nitrospirota bacterium]|jgi:nicotinate-nucleotide adenylyltransferase